jgi:hypothetical protein
MQVMQLLEMILLEIGEESRRAHRMPRNLEIVDMRFPVLTYGVLGRDNPAARHGRLL